MLAEARANGESLPPSDRRRDSEGVGLPGSPARHPAEEHAESDLARPRCELHLSSLQVALSIGLAVSVVAMIGWSREAVRERLRRPLQAAAIAVLAVFVVVMFAANALD